MSHPQWLRAGLAAALLSLAGLGSAQASATPLPLGSEITATLNGSAEALLGSRAGFAALPGSNITPLRDDDLEFLSADYELAADLFSSGLIRLYDNSGTGLWAGTRVLTFSFAGLLTPLGSASLADLSQLLSGQVQASLLDAHTLQITLQDVQWQASTDFGTVDLQLNSAELPEPASAALLAAAAAAALASRRRRSAAPR